MKDLQSVVVEYRCIACEDLCEITHDFEMLKWVVTSTYVIYTCWECWEGTDVGRFDAVVKHAAIRLVN